MEPEVRGLSAYEFKVWKQIEGSVKSISTAIG